MWYSRWHSIRRGGYANEGYLIDGEGNGLQNSLVFDIGNHWRTTKETSGRVMGIEFYDEAPFMSDGNFALHNVFRDMGLDALHVVGQRGAVIESNFFDLTSEQPQALHAPDFPAAILVNLSSEITIRSNTIRDATGNCIDMPGSNHVLIEANLIAGCGQSGIGIFQDYDFNHADSSDVVIRNNVILNSGIWTSSLWQAGVTIAHGKPANITISGNVITDLRPKSQKTQNYGIEVINDASLKIFTKVKGLVIASDNRLDGNQLAATRGVK